MSEAEGDYYETTMSPSPGSDTHHPTATYQPTTTYFPTKTFLPTITYFPTTSPHPTPSYYGQYETSSPAPSKEHRGACDKKPIHVMVDLEGGPLLFCCAGGEGEFDVKSDFNFDDCSLVPPGPNGTYPTPAPTFYRATDAPTASPKYDIATPASKPTPHHSVPPTHAPTAARYTGHPTYPYHPPLRKTMIYLVLRTDYYPEQTYFSLQNAATGEYIWDYPKSSDPLKKMTVYHYSVEVDFNGCYFFVLGDSKGDGLVRGGGFFQLYFNDYMAWNGQMFGTQTSVAVGAGCPK